MKSSVDTGMRFGELLLGEDVYPLGQQYKERLVRLVDQAVRTLQGELGGADRSIKLDFLRGANTLKRMFLDMPADLMGQALNVFKLYQQQYGSEYGQWPGMREVQKFLTGVPLDLKQQFGARR